jgi:hypothetical protein
MSAITATQESGLGGLVSSNKSALFKATPDKYVALGDLVADYAKPDNRDLLIETYGDQGITGFLALTGATRSAGVNDEVQYWEEGRRHKKFDGVYVAADGKIYLEGNDVDVLSGKTTVRLNDVLMAEDGQRFVVTARAGVGDGSSRTSLTVVKMDGSGAGSNVGTDGTDAAIVKKPFIIIGNVYAQGTSQPTEFYQTDVTKRVNPFIITKETYHVNGSQATNIGWINIGGGEYRWYVKGEQDTRKRFMDQREMMMLFSQDADLNASNKIALETGEISGSEGYFQAVSRRGITANGSFGDGSGFADVDEIIFELDKQGAPHEYAMYVDTKTSLDIDDMLAAGIATQNTAGLAGQFGAFQNSPDMAVQLGFKSFTRGGYTFHKHGWKLMSNPQLLGAFSTKPFKGAMVPLMNVVDAKTGMKAPALEMNYKEAGGYSRELEHWVEGGGVLGFKTNAEDIAKFHYRSECNLITRAANQHVILT